jgi:hypothetical protein
MKLKLTAVLAVFCAGLTASFALADNGPGKTKDATKCKNVHLEGTLSSQSLTITLGKQLAKLNLAAGSQLALTLGAPGQTVKVRAEGCALTSAGSTTLTVTHLELNAGKAKQSTASTTTTTTSTTTP